MANEKPTINEEFRCPKTKKCTPRLTGRLLSPGAELLGLRIAPKAILQPVWPCEQASIRSPRDESRSLRTPVPFGTLTQLSTARALEIKSAIFGVEMFRAAFLSAFSEWPHFTHLNSAAPLFPFGRFSRAI